MFFNFILAYDYVTNTFVSVNTLQSLRLGTDKLKSINNYTKNYFDENNKLHIFVSMKKILFLFLILISSVSFGQKKTEGSPLVNYVSKKINQDVTFVVWEEKKDSFRVHEITYYDFKKEDYITLNESNIKLKYPELLDWFTIKVNFPLRRTNRTNVNNLKIINTINLRNWP